MIRLNRDTLYSFAVVDISQGASFTIPEHGERYLSAMVVNEHHYVNAIFHDAGEHRLTLEQFGTPYVVLAVRTLVDPADAADIDAVAALQDAISLDAVAAEPFAMPDYDTTTLDETRQALLALARNLHGFDRMFGSAEQVDPVRHLIGTAAGWGGLPSFEASYIGVDPRLPRGRYELTVRDVPVDGFWSISVYNAEGYFEPNERGAYTINSITGVRDEDGSITVRFGDHPTGCRTCSRSPTDGTIWCGCTVHVPRSSTAPGPSLPAAVCGMTGLLTHRRPRRLSRSSRPPRARRSRGRAPRERP
ncbi:DUF1214 domain-containing protein [Microbacterium sp. p3-SID336]|uniref:DUF1214 domain-containing protein n=1 Tax=Microbacterium sp. p3-SID336 TaxID=2916212 RepID=UPI0021A78069|nr:DUF1214 domain-containing protein [Microbacterium sp. p3-SID336]MCT1477708.1 DUF1214 domain-containing protein [Microbacterium sp. p3-SID336]